MCSIDMKNIWTGIQLLYRKNKREGRRNQQGTITIKVIILQKMRTATAKRIGGGWILENIGKIRKRTRD